jgi:hypothetical protein
MLAGGTGTPTGAISDDKAACTAPHLRLMTDEAPQPGTAPRGVQRLAPVGTGRGLMAAGAP